VLWILLGASVLLAQQIVIARSAGAFTVIACLVVAAAVLHEWRRQRVSPRALAAAAAVVAAGALVAVPWERESIAREAVATPQALLREEGMADHKVRVQGRVAEVAPTYGGGVRIALELESLGDETGALRPASGRISLSIRSTQQLWRTGDRLGVTSRLRRITGFGNFGEFDWPAYNARRGIVAGAYAWDDRDVARLAADDGLVDAVRRSFSEACARRGGQGAELLEALIIGDRVGIDRSVSESIRDAGLAHYLAISGSHMALIVVVVVAVVRRLALATPAVRAGYDVMRAAAVTAMAALLGYAAISGGGVSVTRSVLMAAATLIAMWRGRPDDGLRALGGSAVLLAFQMPGVGEEAGFQLSFAAVGALIVLARSRAGGPADPASLTASPSHSSAGGPRRAAALRVAREGLAVVLVCWLVTSPLVAQCFHRVSLIAPVANLVAAPVVSTIVVVGLLAVVTLPLGPQPAGWLIDLGSLLGDSLAALAHWTAAIPGAAVATPEPGPLLTACLSATPFLLLAPLPLRRRGLPLLVAAIAACVVTGLHTRYRSDVADLWFASVGQGDGAVVRMPGGRVMVIDGGPPGRGHLVMAPLLRRLWVHRIDWLVASHVQADHSGAFLELLDQFDVGELWLPAGRCDSEAAARLIARAAAAGTVVRRVGAGTDAAPGVRVLAPRDEQGSCDANDRSIVLSFEHAGYRALFTGDIEAAGEAALVSAAGQDALRAHVLKVPHHGSRTSSTPPLVAAVAPSVAVASLGLDNRYGFPAPAVEQRFLAAGALWLRTDRTGGVHVVLRRGGISVDTARDGARPLL